MQFLTYFDMLRFIAYNVDENSVEKYFEDGVEIVAVKLEWVSLH